MRIEIRTEKKIGDAAEVREFIAEDEGLHDFAPAVTAVSDVVNLMLSNTVSRAPITPGGES